ncbi:HEAT repeat domain-containing protein [Muriicola marianensis]|uniref:HEAT repeat domain-containing protein n=1 Tax=Muriicola marianensis TaxID=1324801 RepID=A0ABQ1QP67_9FLAO|nr:HEAT repeat domain-containing protein [Muriicola marianensis]GGD38803.1 hypothetical protein GCM10011361_02420 [Muriicola marianensis]
MLLSIPEIHTDLLWDLSVLFGSLCILYFSFIFFFRNRLSAKSRNISDRRKELTPVISNFLFYGEEASKEEKYEYVGLKVEMREFLKDPINRSILKDILLDLQRDLTGDSRNRLLSMYKDFDLHLDAMAKLNSRRWEVVTKGIVELTQMQVVEAYTAIRKFINHRKNVIRRHAQIATVSLKHEGIGHFLDSNRYPISEWQQIKILEVLREKEDFIPPNFGVWLMSANKDVVLFALRLIRYYNQTDANTSVTELLKHRDEEIKQAAIDCIKEFGITDAIPTLMAAFSRAKRDTRILILDAIGTIGKEEHIPFLREVHEKVSNFNVRSKALAAVNTIAPGTILPFKDLDPLIKPESQTLIAEEANEASGDTKEIPTEVETEKIEVAPEADRDLVAPTDVTAEEDIVVSGEHSELFYEDLEVFDHCFMEELNEILEGRNKDDEEDHPGFLPLDFLPLVTEKPTEMDKKKPKKKARKRLWQLRVNYEEVHPDAEFRKELEDILSRVEVQNPEGDTEVEYLNFNFLPFVVGNEPEGDASELPEAEEQESPEEEITPAPASETPMEKVQVVDMIEAENTCSLVDWEALQNEVAEDLSDNSQEEVRQVENKTVDETPGHSIFEELFSKCDEDSKLILLREIPELGDHRELSFLDALKKEPSTRVRKMASDVKRKLQKRLEAEAGKQEQKQSLIQWEKSPQPGDLLEFDLEELKKQGK